MGDGVESELEPVMSGTPQSAPGERGKGNDRGDRPDPATEEFVAHRNLLFTVAYEMLGSAADAEDVLQETWLRWAGVDLATVRDQRAYLVRITTRQALTRCACSAAAWSPTSHVAAEPLLYAPDVAEDVELAKSVSMAMLPVLEILDTPYPAGGVRAARGVRPRVRGDRGGGRQRA